MATARQDRICFFIERIDASIRAVCNKELLFPSLHLGRGSLGCGDDERNRGC
ncbi:MAG: hypothetical protein ACJAQT_004534 [Akkermansiaceae bacterium]|jgi:hypothetical protein